VGSVSVVVDVVDDEPFELTSVLSGRAVTAQRADLALSERIRDQSPDRRLKDRRGLGS